jgi:hypothetical protein
MDVRSALDPLQYIVCPVNTCVVEQPSLSKTYSVTV